MEKRSIIPQKVLGWLAAFARHVIATSNMNNDPPHSFYNLCCSLCMMGIPMPPPSEPEVSSFTSKEDTEVELYVHEDNYYDRVLNILTKHGNTNLCMIMHNIFQNDYCHHRDRYCHRRDWDNPDWTADPSMICCNADYALFLAELCRKAFFKCRDKEREGKQ